ncbi:MAG: glycine--tRNA ligase subunit beta [candidate division WS1 bacterium]|nr:glycine--tRNA ligase subunit beta [candidate division WS1 bacterium]
MAHDTADLLFETGVEEIPAPAVLPALEQLQRLVADGLSGARLAHGEIRTFGTPRRLTVLVEGVQLRQEDLEQEVKGPPAAAAFDGEGNPTKAAQGFAQGKGLSVDDLQVRETDKGAYVFATVNGVGRDAIEVLPEILAGAVSSLGFPKTMRWGSSDFRFARPIRWLLALLGPNVVKLEVAGLQSDRLTWGHRFLSESPISIADPSEYLAKLEDAFVIADHARRLELIEEEATRAAQEAGGSVRLDPDLVEEVNFMVEYPTALVGRFDSRYLELPDDVIVTVMSGHQRYFAVEAADGALMPLFVAIRNGDEQGLDTVRRGNQRVIEPRLADAEFYLAEDMRVKLSDRLEDLQRVTYIEGLGSLYDKTQRLEALVGWLCGRVVQVESEARTAAERAAHLSKCDLNTNMIGDTKLAKLQGRVGAEYARRSGEPEEVALAIGEQYRPQSASDTPPMTTPGRIVALADRIDHLAACFRIGLRPTGSADPHALRRAAQGIVRIILDARWRINMPEFIATALDNLPPVENEDAIPVEQAATQIDEFMRARLEAELANRGVPYDLARAVLAAPCPDLLDAFERAVALRDSRSAGRDAFEQVMMAAERTANIVRKPKAEQQLALAPEALEDPHEVALNEALGEAAAAVESALAPDAGRDYPAAWQALADLRQPIDAFFEAVLVMADDEAVRNNRLALLAAVDDLFLRLLDVQEVVIEGAA